VGKVGRTGASPVSTQTALSSRGLGHSPLKAGTRVRIPLALWWGKGLDGNGPIVYRLGHDPFKVERRVRLPLGLCRARRSARDVVGQDQSWGRSSVWLEHSTVTREVAGSSPVAPVGCWCSCCRPGGEIGRHAILRGWCRKASRFESVPGHPHAVGHSSSVVEHSIRNRAVVSSILTCGSRRSSAGSVALKGRPCGRNSVGRMPASQAGRRGFESHRPLCV
jgi:hypothetical protein